MRYVVPASKTADFIPGGSELQVLSDFSDTGFCTIDTYFEILLAAVLVEW